MSDELADAKKQLRREMRAAFDTLSTPAREMASGQISTQIYSLLRAKNLPRKRVAAYLATPREPQLDALIEHLQKLEIEILAPYFRDAEKPFYTLAPELENIEIVTLEKFTLRVPQEYSGGHARSPEELDVILVPGLAFDLAGNRLGQGGGWYDRVLVRATKAQKKPLKIGVCFDFQILENIPHEAHDVQMNFVVTEKRVLEF